MSVATVYSRTQFGLDSPLVTIEVHLSQGLPAFNIVGMPEIAVRESKDRVRSALINSGFEFPSKRITVNLAPADVPKQGSRFDLAIAIGILVANGQLTQAQVDNIEFIAELSLSGTLRSISDVLSSIISCDAHQHQFIGCNEDESTMFFQPHGSMFFFASLVAVFQHLNGIDEISAFQFVHKVALDKSNLATNQTANFIEANTNGSNETLDLIDVKGQVRAKRALIIAAAGRHNLLLYGSPGSGKTMLANRVSTIMPELSHQKAMETARIYSCAKETIDKQNWLLPPIRHPHHSASPAAVVGGGRMPTPGEISLAHNGVLFLDELTEFHKSVLEHLREPLENHVISLSRAQWKTTFPADIQLIAAMNPCPCGYRLSKIKECKCSQEQVQRYQAKLSGPILDRIDCMVYVDHVATQDLINDKPTVGVLADNTEQTSKQIKQLIAAAQNIQWQRQGCLNARLSNKAVKQYCEMTTQAETMLNQAIDKLSLSARVYYRFLKLARTIADYDNQEVIDIRHISEAISSRNVSF